MTQLRQIHTWDKQAMDEVRLLLSKEGLGLDPHLDSTIGLYEDSQLLATGSYYRNTLRCLAVDSAFQGEGYMAQIVSHLVSELFLQGQYDLFIYTKNQAAKNFTNLGFYEIVSLDEVVFLENHKGGFQKYISSLHKPSLPKEAKIGAIVMNANPFTLGHRYLIEQAADRCDALHLFIVSEDVSAFPREVRERLINEGIADLQNIFTHPTEAYLVSSATFPSYFIRSDDALTLAQAKLDAKVFSQIAKSLDITDRFVGEEPLSPATALYNQAMEEQLPHEGVKLHIFKRKNDDGTNPISASRVRALLKQNDMAGIRALVPVTTFRFLMSEQGQAIAEKLRQELS